VSRELFRKEDDTGDRRTSAGFYSERRVSRAQPSYASAGNENGRVC